MKLTARDVADVANGTVSVVLAALGIVVMLTSDAGVTRAVTAAVEGVKSVVGNGIAKVVVVTVVVGVVVSVDELLPLLAMLGTFVSAKLLTDTFIAMLVVTAFGAALLPGNVVVWSLGLLLLDIQMSDSLLEKDKTIFYVYNRLFSLSLFVFFISLENLYRIHGCTIPKTS